MRIIRVEKLYSSECKVRYEMLAPNVANVFINNEKYALKQRSVFEDAESDLDVFVQQKSMNIDSSTWQWREMTYNRSVRFPLIGKATILRSKQILQ